MFLFRYIHLLYNILNQFIKPHIKSKRPTISSESMIINNINHHHYHLPNCSCRHLICFSHPSLYRHFYFLHFIVQLLTLRSFLKFLQCTSSMIADLLPIFHFYSWHQTYHGEDYQITQILIGQLH